MPRRTCRSTASPPSSRIDPQVLIAHKSSGVDSFEKLKGKTILVGAGGRVTYWPFLKAKYGLTDEQMKPYTFNLAPFLADKNPRPARLHLIGALRHAPSRRGPGADADCRCRLRQLQHHHRHIEEVQQRKEGSRAALRQRKPRRLGPLSQGRGRRSRPPMR